MPAKTERQRKFMGLVRGIQKGTVPASRSSHAAKVARTMPAKSVGDFARMNRPKLTTLQRKRARMRKKLMERKYNQI